MWTPDHIVDVRHDENYFATQDNDGESIHEPGVGRSPRQRPIYSTLFHGDDTSDTATEDDEKEDDHELELEVPTKDTQEDQEEEEDTDDEELEKEETEAPVEELDKIEAPLVEVVDSEDDYDMDQPEPQCQQSMLEGEGDQNVVLKDILHRINELHHAVASNTKKLNARSSVARVRNS
jgi:hypothetical protein